jgi:RNA polymerase sigma-70 factor (ECF subfamily)
VVFFKRNMGEVKTNIVPLRVLPTGSELERGDDEQLMALAAGGHGAAFAVLVQRYLPRVTKFCARFAGQLPLAEELVQEIFLEVWLRRDRYRSQGRFVVFLFTMARHRCLNRVRDEGRRDRREQSVAEDDGSDVPDQLDVLLDKERQRQVQSALLGLSVKLREALLLRFAQGLAYPDVARILGCSESTTRSRVRLAMLVLRDAIAGGGSP